MTIVLGLVILVVALVVAVAGVLSNVGTGHALGHGFAVLGYHVTGSTGALFLAGFVVGAVAVFGLSLLLTGARRTSRRGHMARGDLIESRQETADVSQDREHLIDQRDSARAESAAALRTTAMPGEDRRPDAERVRRPDHELGGATERQEVRDEREAAHQPALSGLEPSPEPLGSSGERPSVRT